MEDLIVGEDSLEVNHVAKAIKESASCALLLQNWRCFCFSLGIRDTKVLDLQRKLNSDAMQLEDLPREILFLWKAEKQNKAHFQELLNSLIESGVRSIAESLQIKFCQAQRRDYNASNNTHLGEECLPLKHQRTPVTNSYLYLPD